MAQFCSNCGTALKDDQRFCPNCGTPVPTPASNPIPEPPQGAGAGTDPWAVPGGTAPQPDLSSGYTAASQGGAAPGSSPQPSQNFQPGGDPWAASPQGTGCGADGQSGAAANGTVYGYDTSYRCATKKEFLALPQNHKLRSQLRAAAIICYVCAGLTLVMGLMFMMITSLFDVALLVGFGLGIHLAQSRVCAILLAVDAGINMILGLIVNGSLNGWLIAVAAVFAIICTFQLEKQWKAYQAGVAA